MNAKDVATGVQKSIIDENLETYRDLFINTPPHSPTDLYWKNALALFHLLPLDKRNVFFSIIRQVAVDTASNILGAFDGVNVLKGMQGDIAVISDGKKVSGDLQSLFLREEEKRT